MKNSFTLFEIILSLIISSMIIIYSSLFIKELYEENIISSEIHIKQIDLLSTKIFLQKNKKYLNELKFENNNLYFRNSLLLEKVTNFEMSILNRKVRIFINLDDNIIEEWTF